MNLYISEIIMSAINFPAEWHPVSAVQLTWPHASTDWAPVLTSVEPCFADIARAILKESRLIIVAPETDHIRKYFSETENQGIHFAALPTNDTWARDHGAIGVIVKGEPTLLDFTFNGWGLKFASNYDNLLTRKIYEDRKIFNQQVRYANHLNFVLEGGSIETDGEGTLLTTSECLMSPNRNGYLDKHEIERYLMMHLGISRVLWLNHGYLAGDDTDSHIDTLARFCSPTDIAYVKCTNPADEHFDALCAMEEELKEFRTSAGKPYHLHPLPMPRPITDTDGQRLPATYANFLIVNNSLLVPTYHDPADEHALSILSTAFPKLTIVPVDCLPLILQHGSLHCVTMQYPNGFVG